VELIAAIARQVTAMFARIMHVPSVQQEWHFIKVLLVWEIVLLHGIIMEGYAHNVDQTVITALLLRLALLAQLLIPYTTVDACQVVLRIISRMVRYAPNVMTLTVQHAAQQVFAHYAILLMLFTMEGACRLVRLAIIIKMGHALNATLTVFHVLQLLAINVMPDFTFLVWPATPAAQTVLRVLLVLAVCVTLDISCMVAHA